MQQNCQFLLKMVDIVNTTGTHAAVLGLRPSVIHLISGMVVVENAGLEKSGADSRGGKR